MALLVFAVSGCDALLSPQQRIERAQTDIELGEWGYAAIELHKALQAQPSNARAWLLLATVSLDAADSSGAIAALRDASQTGASASELDRLRVRAWLAMGHPKALIDAATRGVLAIPEPDRTIALARAYEELHQPEHALELLQPILTARPHLVDARLVAARALAAEGKADEALRATDIAIAEHPRSYSSLLVRGEILEQRGSFAAAEKALNEAIHNMQPATPLSDRGAALVALGDSRLAQGDVDGAAQSEAQLTKLFPESPRTRVLSARIKLARHDDIGGIADLERAVDQAPDLVQARLLLASAQLARGNVEQAQTQLNQILQIAPDDYPARKLLASARLKLGDPQRALRLLAPAIVAHSGDPQLLALLRQAGQRTGNSNIVIQALEDAVGTHPQDRNLHLELASTYLTADRAPDALRILEQLPDVAGDLRRDALLVSTLRAVRGPAAAAKQVDELLAAHPGDLSIIDFAGSYFVSAREYDRARVLLHRTLGANPRDLGALLTLARLDSETGDEAGAESALRTSLSIAPESSGARIALADLLARKHAFTEAEQLLSSGRAEHHPDLLFALARVEIAKGDSKLAGADLDRAIRLEPGHAEIVNSAGMLFLKAHEYSAALARFAKAAEMAPEEPEYRLNVARAYLALNQLSAARESLEKASELRPRWLPAVKALVLIDLEEKSAQSALARVNDLIAAEPHDPGALVLEGDTDVATGRPQEAIAAYRSAQHELPSASTSIKLFQALAATGNARATEPLEQWLARTPNDTTVRDVLGEYYLRRRDLNAALRAFQAASKYGPDDVITLNNLAWTYMQLGDPRAESIAEKALGLAPHVASVEDTLGWILARKDLLDRALPLLAEAANAGTADLDIQYHYAYVLAETGKRAEARAILTKTLAAKSRFDSEPAAQRLLTDLRD